MFNFSGKKDKSEDSWLDGQPYWIHLLCNRVSIYCLIKITCIKNHNSGLCLCKINACYHIENWRKFNCLISWRFAKFFLLAIILILSLQTKDLQNAICLKVRLNWSLNCSTILIGENQTRMIKRPSKKKIQLWYLIFIYYSLPLNPSIHYSFPLYN